jgi:hypothetical protein
VNGPYLLKITPGPGCATPKGSLTFPMDAAAAGTLPHPGNQVVLRGDPSRVELEFQYVDFTLRGGMGTTEEGALSNEGSRLWMRAIGTGGTTQTADGHGEVLSGTLMGYLALGGPTDEEGALGTCSALDHTFTLRVQ